MPRAPREMHSSEIPLTNPKSIDMDDREPEVIVADRPIQSDHYSTLAFMEEPVTIRLDRPNEKFPASVCDFYVNGEVRWVPVGKPYTLPRKFVEVIARAQPYDVATEVLDENSERPRNMLRRFVSNRYPFSVIRDDNPRGQEWLMQIVMGG